jgi:hypothetical protein
LEKEIKMTVHDLTRVREKKELHCRKRKQALTAFCSVDAML